MELALKIIGGLIISLGVFIFFAREFSKPVSVDREFNANIETIWKLWEDPDSMKKWWGPNNFSAPVVENDLREGGRFLLGMKSPQGDVSYNAGTYLEVVRLQRIVAHMSFSDERGNLIPGDQIRVPGKWPDFVSVKVEFSSPAPNKTHVHIEEAGIPFIMWFFAKLGWEQQFDKIENLIK